MLKMWNISFSHFTYRIWHRNEQDEKNFVNSEVDFVVLASIFTHIIPNIEYIYISCQSPIACVQYLFPVCWWFSEITFKNKLNYMFQQSKSCTQGEKRNLLCKFTSLTGICLILGKQPKPPPFQSAYTGLNSTFTPQEKESNVEIRLGKDFP